MNIKSIEPTPSPNTMKILLDEELPFGKSHNYKASQVEDAPPLIKQILTIEGVKGVYHVADFLAVERNAKYNWEPILQQIKKSFGEKEASSANHLAQETSGFGEINVFAQMLYGIPFQLKITDSTQEKRIALPKMFTDYLLAAQRYVENVVTERQWVSLGVRYGDIENIEQEILEEMIASYPAERLKKNLEAIKEGQKSTTGKREFRKLTLEDLQDPDWSKRFQALQQANPTEEDIEVLAYALKDEKVSIRRLATAYLGGIESDRVIPYLHEALKDRSFSVRRTAGDSLSDLGSQTSFTPMMEALKDENKLVRWRAAMYFYENGDETCLEALKQAGNDPEFEVKMQVKMAIKRIKEGQDAKGSIWKQMLEERE